VTTPDSTRLASGAVSSRRVRTARCASPDQFGDRAPSWVRWSGSSAHAPPRRPAGTRDVRIRGRLPVVSGSRERGLYLGQRPAGARDTTDVHAPWSSQRSDVAHPSTWPASSHRKLPPIPLITWPVTNSRRPAPSRPRAGHVRDRTGGPAGSARWPGPAREQPPRHRPTGQCAVNLRADIGRRHPPLRDPGLVAELRARTRCAQCACTPPLPRCHGVVDSPWRTTPRRCSRSAKPALHHVRSTSRVARMWSRLLSTVARRVSSVCSRAADHPAPGVVTRMSIPQGVHRGGQQLRRAARLGEAATNPPARPDSRRDRRWPAFSSSSPSAPTSTTRRRPAAARDAQPDAGGPAGDNRREPGQWRSQDDRRSPPERSSSCPHRALHDAQPGALGRPGR